MKILPRLLFPLVPLFALVLLPGCYRSQYRTLVLKVPGLKSGPCTNTLRDRLMGMNEKSKDRELEFFREVTADTAAGTLTVVYNSSVTAGMNVLHWVGSMGYDASDASDPTRSITADPEARKRLPAECR